MSNRKCGNEEMKKCGHVHIMPSVNWRARARCWEYVICPPRKILNFRCPETHSRAFWASVLVLHFVLKKYFMMLEDKAEPFLLLPADIAMIA